MFFIVFYCFSIDFLLAFLFVLFIGFFIGFFLIVFFYLFFLIFIFYIYFIPFLFISVYEYSELYQQNWELKRFIFSIIKKMLNWIKNLEYKAQSSHGMIQD